MGALSPALLLDMRRLATNAAALRRAYHAAADGHRAGMSATTVLCVRKGDQVVMIGDGQVTSASL